MAVPFSELPGWDGDRPSELWPALRRGCARPALDWVAFCQQAVPLPQADDAALRDWLQQRLQPYRVEAPDGAPDGLLTGYFEPLVEASRQPRGAYRLPLYAPPADLASRRPYWTRQQIDTLPAAQAALRGREIAYVADPLDALVLQIQGSGRLRIKSANGSEQFVRAAYAGLERPALQVGRPLADRAGRAQARPGFVAGDKGLGAAQPEACQRDAVEQPALRVLPRGAAARPGARPARRTGRAADARGARSPSIR